MTSICRSIAATVLLLFLTACHGWDRPLYEENPASGGFVLGTWVNQEKGIIRIFEKDKKYYAIILDREGAAFLQFSVTHHNDMILLNYDLASVRTLPPDGNKEAAKMNDRHLYEAFSAKATERGLIFSGLDEKSLSKILEDAGVRSTDDVCRSLAEQPKEPPAEKPSLLERCSVINTEFVERTLGNKDLPLDQDHPIVLTPLAY